MNKKTVIGAFSALTMLLVPIASSNVALANEERKTTPSWLNVRSGPSANYKIVTSVKQGTVVTILQDRTGWDKISVNGKTGYVNERYLKNYTAPIPTKSIGKKVVNTGSTSERLNIRKSASASTTIVGKLTHGTVIDIYSVTGSWASVRYGGVTGYVHTAFLKNYVAPVQVKAIAKKVVNTGSLSERLNIRKSASASSTIVGKLTHGTVIDIYSVTGSWASVNHSGVKGYVHTAFLKDVPTPVVTAPVTSTSTYTVQSGDTLYSISRNYKLTISSLKALNNLTSDIIRVGQKLNVTGTASVTPVSAPVYGVLHGKTIVLDPGHGGSRPGAVANGIVEKEVNLDVSKRIQAKLEAAGAKVVLTRTTDRDCRPNVAIGYDLQCRVDVARNAKGDIFISVHANAAGSAARGAETFYYNAQDKPLALTLQKNYVETTGLYNRSVRQGLFHVIRNNSTMPSALLELGFLTNTGDSALLRTSAFRDKAAEGTFRGIVDYFN